jgi:hypothetical protein
MTQERKAVDNSSGSKYRKMLLVILTAIMFFGAPYTVYLLAIVLEISYLVSVALGFAMIVIGLFLVWYLIKNKILT